MDKSINLDLDDKKRMAQIAKALSAEIRIEILRLLCGNSYNINEIAKSEAKRS